LLTCSLLLKILRAIKETFISYH